MTEVSLKDTDGEGVVNDLVFQINDGTNDLTVTVSDHVGDPLKYVDIDPTDGKLSTSSARRSLLDLMMPIPCKAVTLAALSLATLAMTSYPVARAMMNWLAVVAEIRLKVALAMTNLSVGMVSTRHPLALAPARPIWKLALPLVQRREPTRCGRKPSWWFRGRHSLGR